MDFGDAPAQRVLRQEVRGWLSQNVPVAWRQEAAHDSLAFASYLRGWQAKLHKAGLVGLSWPVEFGGRGLSVLDEQILFEELGRVDAPPLPSPVGMFLVGPALIRFGTEEQQRRYLPRILSAADIWCQGYSEPNAGSDLSNLSTRATRQQDGSFRVSGQKIWTSRAEIADRCFLLARTDPAAPKREGISCLLVDMSQRGVEVRPIRDITGLPHFSEVFFDEAVVPPTDLLGTPNAGWQIAMQILGSERRMPTRANVAPLESILADLGRTLDEGGIVLTEISERALGAAARDVFTLRALRLRQLGEMSGGTWQEAEASLQKLTWDRTFARIHEAAWTAAGARMAVDAGGPWGLWRDGWLTTPGHAIGGGTVEIQLNAIAIRLLGLPRGGR
jgi:alkylation response protein AidB-like acyl-CoA dehydrogenase